MAYQDTIEPLAAPLSAVQRLIEQADVLEMPELWTDLERLLSGARPE